MSVTEFHPAPLTIESAILETLAYFDVFDYPLRLEELHRYLHRLPTTTTDVQGALRSPLLADRIDVADGCAALAGRGALIISRLEHQARGQGRMRAAVAYGRVLGKLPFVRMVALTGSIAMQSSDSNADFDYMLVAAPGRLWLARAFAVSLGRWAAFRGYVLCPNVILSERALLWRQQDVYSAHELTQMIPLAGRPTYDRLRDLNGWTQIYLPNAGGPPGSVGSIESVAGSWRPPIEYLLGGALGNQLERLEMTRKIARFTHQSGYGVETVFTADVCQGNFQHHGQRTRQAFEHKLVELGLGFSGLWASPVSTRPASTIPETNPRSVGRSASMPRVLSPGELTTHGDD